MIGFILVVKKETSILLGTTSSWYKWTTKKICNSVFLDAAHIQFPHDCFTCWQQSLTFPASYPLANNLIPFLLWGCYMGHLSHLYSRPQLVYQLNHWCHPILGCFNEAKTFPWCQWGSLSAWRLQAAGWHPDKPDLSLQHLILLMLNHQSAFQIKRKVWRVTPHGG